MLIADDMQLTDLYKNLVPGTGSLAQETYISNLVFVQVFLVGLQVSWTEQKNSSIPRKKLERVWPNWEVWLVGWFCSNSFLYKFLNGVSSALGRLSNKRNKLATYGAVLIEWLSDVIIYKVSKFR